MTRRNDTPAFPAAENVQDPRVEGVRYLPGMTLRQYYAGQAAAGMLANSFNGHVLSPASLAQRARDVADALLEELDK